MLEAPAQQPMNVLWAPQVLTEPTQQPAKKLLVPVPPVPEIQLTMLLVPQKLNTELPPPPGPVAPVRPLAPVAPTGPPDGPCGPCGPCGPVAPIPPPPPDNTPLMYKPVALTHKRLHPPGANTAVLVSVVVPRKLPIMMLFSPVVTQQPALQPTNMLLAPVVLRRPAHAPAKKLLAPVVLY